MFNMIADIIVFIAMICNCILITILWYRLDNVEDWLQFFIFDKDDTSETR
jgi:hypothetical protein